MKLKCHWCSESLLYDGSQLRSLFAYNKFGVLGDSIFAWIGPCKIPSSNILDVEDRLNRQSICGKEMLHFVVELFHVPLSFGVLLQRIMAAIATELLHELSSLDLHSRSSFFLFREGDDLYIEEAGERSKLSISVATKTPVSSMVHFAFNVVKEGVPVKAMDLKTLKVEPEGFAKKFMVSVRDEVESVVLATKKVQPVS